MQPATSPQPALHHHDGRAHRVLDPGRLLFGASILTIGVLFLLQAFDVLDAGDVIGSWWPVVIVAAGLLQLAERRGSVVGPLVVTGIGAVLLLATTGAIEGDAWDYVWPVAVVVLGASILLGRPFASVPADAAPDDVVRATGIFGGPKIRPRSRRFRHASLTALFGGVTLDLREATLDPAGATVTATVAFGGIDVLVPHGWRIALDGTPILGGMADKTAADGALPEDAPTLEIDGVVLLGGLEVKH